VKKKLLVCCAVLLCTSLVFGQVHQKPLPSTSTSKANVESAYAAPITVQNGVNLKKVERPTNSKDAAMEALQRAAFREGLKGARTTGDDCGDPIAITLGAGDLPYVTSDTTVSRYNDYTETALESYDGGQDIIYEVTLTEDLNLAIGVEGEAWVGVVIDSTCPPGSSAIATAVDPKGMPQLEAYLTAGTYYVMVDTWPQPDATDFLMTFDTVNLQCTVPCPPEGYMEGEPACGDGYNDTYNGGCNSSPAVFQPIACGDTVCGTSGTFDFNGSSYRDTDWYELTLTQAQEVTWSAEAEFDVLIFIIDAGSGNCVDYSILGYTTGVECDKINLTMNLAPGTYWLWVGPSVFSGVPCTGEGSNYVASVECNEPAPCQIDYSVNAPGSWSGNTCGAGNDCDLGASEDVMYEVTIPHDGIWDINLCNSSYDTYLYVGTLCCDDDLGSVDDSCGLQSNLVLFLTAGTYYVDVEGFSTNCGAYQLDITEVFGPDNDFCQNATDAGTLMDDVPVVINGDNTGATSDCPSLGYPEAWIVFTLPECMDVTIAYCGTTPAFNNGYIVLDQSCPCSGLFIYTDSYDNTACGDGNYSLYWDELPAGTYYWPILTDSTYYYAEGPYTITITGSTCEICDVVCDPAATPEGEPLCGPNYEDTYNGGCNSSPSVFSTIACNDTVCGESGTYSYFGSSYRDTDWYEFTLYAPATVTWDVVAEFDLLVFLIDAGSGNCSDFAILGSATANDCDHASLTIALDAGTYWAWVGPSVFSGVPCGAEYEGVLTVDPPEACTPFGACCLLDGTCIIATEADCLAQGGDYQGDDTECSEAPPPPPPECVDPDATITIEILTDPWPSETTWTLTELGYGVIATGGPYANQYTLYTTDVDVCSTSCYEFEIFDAFGDGIYAPGGYTVYYEGSVVASTMGSGWCCTSETVSNIGGGCGGGSEPCVDPDQVCTIEIFTDNYPSETTWQLVEQGVGIVASGGPYSSSQTLYTYNVDICSTSCYVFTIFDAFGDGICCSYGYGYYNILVDGDLVATGGAFGDEETKTFGECGGCSDPDTTATVEILTDAFPSETTWTFSEEGLGAVASGGPYSSAYTLYTQTFDVCSTSCYIFDIYDAFGDGICCAYGYGYFNVYFDGVLVGTGGAFGSHDSIEDIGMCQSLGACWIGYCGVCVDTTLECCEYAGGTFQGYGTTCETAPPPICADVDIKPGSCPNSFNRGSNGVLPVALVGTMDFDVMDVDISTLRISRLDGMGGEVAPHEGPPGPHTVYSDVATPFDNDGCECQEMTGDGIMDISMKFDTPDVVAGLEMGDLDPGSLVPLLITGNLMDGTAFAGMDCVRLVPPGSPPGALEITSNLPEAWVDVTPLDEQLDGGGYADFARTYPEGTVVTLTAGEMPGRSFMGWNVDGVPTRGASVQITVVPGLQTAHIYARYAEMQAPKGQPGTPQGQVGGVPLP
jgi:hypothetical protein